MSFETGQFDPACLPCDRCGGMPPIKIGLQTTAGDCRCGRFRPTPRIREVVVTVKDSHGLITTRPVAVAS